MDIEHLEILPKKESRKEYITRKYGNMWDLRRFDHPWYRSDKNDDPYIIVKRVIKKYFGKSFDDAFSYYCKLVKKQDQEKFLNEFTARRWRYADYTIDSQKRIIYSEHKYRRKKKPIVFISFDYEEGYYHVIGKRIVNISQIMRQSNHNKYSYNQSYYESSPQWIKIIIKGYKKTFESRKDPEYKKLMAEKIKAEKKNKKLFKKQQSEKAYCFLTNKELEEHENNSI